MVSFSFASPNWFFLIVPFAAILLWDLVGRSQPGTVAIADLEYLRTKECFSHKGRRATRATCWLFLVIFISMIWARPTYLSREPLFQRSETVAAPKFLFMLDVSRSMSTPLGLEKSVRLPGQPVVTVPGDSNAEGRSRYDAAREALWDFMSRFDSAQIGLILFSTEPILARWPTTEIANGFREVLEENIGRGELSQLQSFSSLTNTNKALSLAREVIGSQSGPGAIVLITDAEDDLRSLGLAVRNVRKDGIRLYIIGVGVSEKSIERISKNFKDDADFRIFRVDSEDEMQNAHRLVAEVEGSRTTELDESVYESDLGWLFALVLSLVVYGGLWVFENFYHESHGGRTRKRES